MIEINIIQHVTSIVLGTIHTTVVCLHITRVCHLNLKLSICSEIDLPANECTNNSWLNFSRQTDQI